MGAISKISGPVIQATGMRGNTINELVKVGELELMGEIISLKADRASIQVYEETSGLRPGEKVTGTGMPLSVELGPGLLSSVFDGIQRPLDKIRAKGGDFITRGIVVNALDRKKKWDFIPLAKKGDKVSQGDIIGEVSEFNIKHKIVVPVGVSGKLDSIEKGSFTVEQPIAEISGKPILMMQLWPVRQPRPYKEKKHLEPPLITGMRIIDTLFPVAKGGTAAIPGPFGSGKCVSGSTPVLLQDGSLRTMKELYEFAREKGESRKTVFDETIELPQHSALRLYSVKGGQVAPTSTTTFYKGKSDKLLRITLRSGKSVEVTPIHKLFTLSGQGEILEVQAKDLRAGDFIAAPRKLPIIECGAISADNFASIKVCDEGIRQEISFMLRRQAKAATWKGLAAELGLKLSQLRLLACKQTLPTLAQAERIYAYFGVPLAPVEEFAAGMKGKRVRLPRQMTPELAEFLGLFVSEGYVRALRTVVFTNTDEALLSRFAALSQNLFGVKARVERQPGKAPNVLISSKALSCFVASLCGSGSRNKRVPSCVLGAAEQSVSAFLESYFLGDGSFSRGKNEVEFATASRQLQTGLSYLLCRLGVLHSMRTRTIAGREYYRVFARGAQAERLAAVFSTTWEKTRQLKQYAASGIRHYDSVDVVPLSPAFIAQVYEALGRQYSVLKANGVEISNYTTNRERMSASAFRAFAAQVQLERLSQVERLLDWVYFDPVASIEEVAGPHDVYDVVLPGIENFVGGFGGVFLHNTVTNTTLAKQCDAQIIVYVGCGERGNEMTEVLQEFPKLIDPTNGRPLMERTVLIANTSNMPVAARESSIYTGITIAEYYRDLGFDVAMMADSTSRWAEAMREISGRMEEMPGEEGYPAYLGKRLAEFYERAGRVWCLGSGEGKNARDGSVTVVGAVSPPGGDLSEPVSQSTLRVTKVFWALDANLSRRRHYPAINWLRSYSIYLNELRGWYAKNVAEDFFDLRNQAMALLQQEAELQNIVQLIGPDALPDKERLVLDATKMIREDFLQQNSFDKVDTYASLNKQYEMLKTVLHFYDKASAALGFDVPLAKVLEAKEREEIAKLKYVAEGDVAAKCKALRASIDKSLAK